MVLESTVSIKFLMIFISTQHYEAMLLQISFATGSKLLKTSTLTTQIHEKPFLNVFQLHLLYKFSVQKTKVMKSATLAMNVCSREMKTAFMEVLASVILMLR